METTFTPLSALGGGMLIGLSAVLLMLGLGRILGATGVLSGLVFPTDHTAFKWRAAMILGMVLSPGLLFFVTGEMPQLTIPVSPIMVVIGGVVVGFGASMGSGCTSGHGVCGLSRLSLRSLIAVPVFMATAAITVFSVRHILGL